MSANIHKPDLLKQNDIVSFYHIQMPHWLFADKRYKQISLAAKVAYSLLLNRYQLSKLHGWINGDGEVYIIFPRDELAKTLQVGAHKAISIFKELKDAGLVWEKRRGNNKANHIYLTRVVLSDEDAADYDNAPFIPGLAGGGDPFVEDAGSAEYACPDGGDGSDDVGCTETTSPSDYSEHAKNALPELSAPQPRPCDKRTSGDAESAVPDMQYPHTSHTYYSQNEYSKYDLSQSVSLAHARESPDGQTDDEIAELDEILHRCDLWTFKPETAKVFESAIERLFFSESLKIGNCILPRKKVRSHLHELDQIKLHTAEQKIARNIDKKIRNTTAYTMAVIFNSIWETESDVLSDPYLNSLQNDGNDERG